MDIDKLLTSIYRLTASTSLAVMALHLVASYGWLALALIPGLVITLDWLWTREVRKD